MKGVFYLNTITNLKFIRAIVKREYVNPSTGKVINGMEIVIKLQNTLNGKSRIHKLSSFLNDYMNNKPKYVCDIADDIVVFLNYIYFTLNTKELNHISELSFDVGSKFLNEYGTSRSSTVVSRMDKNLTKFYYYLAKNNILKNITKDDFVIIVNNRTSIKSPFEGTYKTLKKSSPKPLHNMSKELVFMFYSKVLEVSPQIALGVYFQLFGDLRISEVISIEYSDISLKGNLGSQGLTVQLSPKDLRPDLNSAFIRTAKKTRKQAIISINGLLPKIYHYHIKNFKFQNTNSVFSNNKGLPMTDILYRYYFNKSKRAFIDDLINSPNLTLKSQGLFLNNQKWSTHVFRGIFSNMVAEISDNISEIATWRGDSTFNASLSYLTDNKSMENKLDTLMSEYYTEQISTKVNDLLKE